MVIIKAEIRNVYYWRTTNLKIRVVEDWQCTVCFNIWFRNGINKIKLKPKFLNYAIKCNIITLSIRIMSCFRPLFSIPFLYLQWSSNFTFSPVPCHCYAFFLYIIKLWRTYLKVIMCQAQINSNKKNEFGSARIVDILSLMRQNESTSESYHQASIKYTKEIYTIVYMSRNQI